MRIWMASLAMACALGVQAAPKVAVSDLAYEERVQEYVHEITAQNQAQNNGYSASASASYHEVESSDSYIERGELRKFTGDIKGEILKSGLFQLIQAKPYTAQANEGLYDVIARIKQGHFRGADYVLFGSVSDIDFRSDVNAIANTDSYSKVLGLTLVADFSLIDTRTYAITSAFTALGEGQDTKLINGNDGLITSNRGRVIRDVSKSIGEDVTRQLKEQLLGTDSSGNGSYPMQTQLPADQPAQILR